MDEPRAPQAGRQAFAGARRGLRPAGAAPPAGAGPCPAISLQTTGGFQVQNPEAAMEFEKMYEATKDPMIQATGRETFEAMNMLQSIQQQAYTPAAGAQ